MQDALASNTLSIGRIGTRNEVLAKRCIENLFTGLSMYFDKPLEPHQANMISTELLSNYNYRQLRVEDLVVICNKLKNSEIFKLTVHRILTAVNKYTSEREQAAMYISRNQSDRHKSMKDFANSTIESRAKKAYKAVPPSRLKRKS